MAQWIRHLTTNQGIPGSSPGKVAFFFIWELASYLFAGGFLFFPPTLSHFPPDIILFLLVGVRIRTLYLSLCLFLHRLMDCQVKILPEQYLPPPPLHISPCPAHVYSGYHATQLMARQPNCTIYTCTQLDRSRKRLQVSVWIRVWERVCVSYLGSSLWSNCWCSHIEWS